jgi:hypothetical protein
VPLSVFQPFIIGIGRVKEVFGKYPDFVIVVYFVGIPAIFKLINVDFIPLIYPIIIA